LLGAVAGLVVGKLLGVLLASELAIQARLARASGGVSLRALISAACLCGVGDTVALLMADQVFATGTESAIAKIGVLVGSALAAALGTLGLGPRSAPATQLVLSSL
jgi:Na+:H+ antiporter, NhaA family